MSVQEDNMVDVVVTAQFYTYVIQGSVIFATNGLLTYAIISVESLRKKYTILLWQMFVDTVMGLAQTMAGIARLYVVYARVTDLRSKRYCILMPWNLIAVWSEPMVSICLLMVSIDRLLALVMPITYYKRSELLQTFQITMWNVLLCMMTVTIWYFSLLETEEVLSPLCWTSDAMLTEFTRVTLFMTILASVGSVLLYGVVFTISKRYAIRLQGFMDRQYSNAFVHHQRQLTVTMGISCIFTLILFVLPVFLKLFLMDVLSPLPYELLRGYSGISCNLNPLANIAIVVRRHQEIRNRLRRILPCAMNTVFSKVDVAPAAAPHPSRVSHAVSMLPLRRDTTR